MAEDGWLFGTLQTGAQHIASLFQFILARTAADAEYHTEVYTIDYRGRTAAANHRKGLARDGEEANGHKHIDAGLYGHKKDEAHGQEGGEIALATAGYSPCLEELEHIEGSHS